MSDYCRREIHARTTGALVTIYDTDHRDNVFDPAGGRWVTFCEDHGTLVNHETLHLAATFVSHPEVFCDECAHLHQTGRKVVRT